MNSADSLALLGRVMGGLIVVLVLIGLAARVARRTGGNTGVSGLKVIDRVGLSREANLAVVEVGDRMLLLGVTAQGVTLLADLDEAPAGQPSVRPAAREHYPVDDVLQDDDPNDLHLQAGDVEDGFRDETAFEDPVQNPVQDQVFAGPAFVEHAFEEHAFEEPAFEDALPVERETQRLPLPSGVALDQYPDLASALRAAGRTATTGGGRAAPAGRVRSGGSELAVGSAITVAPRTARNAAMVPDPASMPRTRAEARAEARSLARANAGLTPATPSGRGRIPLQRKKNAPKDKKRVVPPPQAQASGSVLSPQTWRQGIEALRDLTVRRG